MSISTLMLFCSQFYCSVVQFEVRVVTPPQFFCFSGIFQLSWVWYVCLHIKLEIVLLRSMNYCVGNLMGFTWYLQIAFRKVAIFNILMLPIHVQGRSFHLLMFSTISFSNVVMFYCTSLSFAWLKLLLDNILCVCGCCERHCFPVSSSACCHLYIGKLLVFVC